MEHHQTVAQCWVVCYRSKRPVWDALPYIDLVEEALCFGWIDSTLKKLPDGRLVQRMSPRRKNSHWTDLNRQRCQSLVLRGLMTPVGLAALPAKECKEYYERAQQETIVSC